MSQNVSANYTMPAILNTLKPAASGGTAKTASTTTGSTTSSSNTTTSTFLNLLVKELQNQDPTAPVDSTAMVGQMISLNQLNQLISINSALTTPSTTPTTTGQAQPVGAAASGAAVAAANSGIAKMLPSSTATAATSQLPFDPNTLMPLNSGLSNAGAAATSNNSPLNAATMGFPGLNNTSGGK